MRVGLGFEPACHGGSAGIDTSPELNPRGSIWSSIWLHLSHDELSGIRSHTAQSMPTGAASLAMSLAQRLLETLFSPLTVWFFNRWQAKNPDRDLPNYTGPVVCGLSATILVYALVMCADLISLYCVVLYCIVLCCVVLYCSAPHRTASAPLPQLQLAHAKAFPWRRDWISGYVRPSRAGCALVACNVLLSLVSCG